MEHSTRTPPDGKTCPACSQPLQGRENYCPNCGSRLTSARKDDNSETSFGKINKREFDCYAKNAAAERKDVTILFADIVGSLEIIEKLDPEDAQEALNPALEIMVQAVQRHNGTVARLLGDGLMALFGAPVSSEHHAVSACMAAIDMRDLVAAREPHPVGSAIKLRIGLNSGEVVVGSYGAEQIGEYNVIGEPAHLAARIEQAAQPGCINATSQTIRQAESHILFSYIGPLRVNLITQASPPRV